jgi:hypothetical protein
MLAAGKFFGDFSKLISTRNFIYSTPSDYLFTIFQAANAITTLRVIKPYRAYVCSLFRLKSHTNRVSITTAIPGSLAQKFHDRSTTQNTNFD